MSTRKIISEGIDISNHNGALDFNVIKNAGEDFVIIRTGFGVKSVKQIDTKFEINYAKCKANNIPVGAYHYSYALTVAGAIKEAEFVLELIKGKSFEYPIFFDFEDITQVNLSQVLSGQIITAFCNTLEAAGYWAGVYSYDTKFASSIPESITTAFTTWVAKVDSGEPKYCKRYDIWQNSWTKRINGINTPFDGNICYVDFPTIIKAKGINGFTKPSTTATKPEVTTPAVTNTTPTPTTTVSTPTTATTTGVSIDVSAYSYSKRGSVKLSDHFAVKEFASKSGTKIYSDTVLISAKLIKTLERLRTTLAASKYGCSKIIVTSGFRTKAHDIAVGGSGTGQHTLGKAADIICYTSTGAVYSAKSICNILSGYGDVYGIGYISKTATHVDMRDASLKWWGDETRNKATSIINLGFKTFPAYWASIK